MSFPFTGVHYDPNAGGGAAVAPAPAAPPAAPPAADPGASPTPGSAAAPPAAVPESPNIKQLREQYEATKAQLEPWTRLNLKPDDVAAHYPVLQKMRTEATELGEALGYDAAEVQEFFLKDPVQVLAYLRQQRQTRQAQPLTQGDLKKQLDKMVEERLKPITQREDLRLNKEAEFRFDGEFDKLFKTEFKDGLPDEVRDALYEMVGQLVGEDDAAIRRLKFEGQVSDVAKYFEQAKTRVLKTLAAWSAHERKRAGGEPPPPPGTPSKPKSKLDDKLSTGQTVKELFNL